MAAERAATGRAGTARAGDAVPRNGRSRPAAQRRFAMVVFSAFALVALVLAATGIYGVLAGSVAERRREIGVRCAMGTIITSTKSTPSR